jgi:tRNA(fMet)-specific endonuclease VapC
MRYMLDTNICIYTIKKKPESILEKFNSISPFEIGVSTITIAELEYGARKSAWPQKNLFALQQFLTPFEFFGFDYNASIEYGIIRSELEAKGTPIGSLDMLIAAQAKSLGCVLVSNNLKEFNRVNGLKVENWV